MRGKLNSKKLLSYLKVNEVLETSSSLVKVGVFCTFSSLQIGKIGCQWCYSKDLSERALFLVKTQSWLCWLLHPSHLSLMVRDTAHLLFTWYYHYLIVSFNWLFFFSGFCQTSFLVILAVQDVLNIFLRNHFIFYLQWSLHYCPLFTP